MNLIRARHTWATLPFIMALLGATATASAADATTKPATPWDVPALENPPAVEWLDRTAKVHSLLYDAEPLLERPPGEPAVDVEEGGVRTRMWPVEGAEIAVEPPLLIADGHHRYETAVAYRAENPSATHTFAVLVSSRAPGLEIFPTHRLVQAVGDVPGEETDAPDGGVTLYRDGRYLRVASGDDFGPRVVESLQPAGVSYTASAADAVAAVDRGDAAAAFLLEPVTFEQVARFAHAGETMPQKSTFFFPKLTSGLLFHTVG